MPAALLYDPGLHRLQPPVTTPYPTSQIEHDDAPVPVVVNPTGQKLQVVAPAEATVPTAQLMQVDDDVAPTADELVPAVHWVHNKRPEASA